MSTPCIAVERNSRPAGSSRKATGAPAISQAARQTALRASSPAASSRTTRPSAPMPRAWSRRESSIRRASRSVDSRSSSWASTRARRVKSCSSSGAEAAGLAGHGGQRADARAVGELERHGEVGAGAEPALHLDVAVDGIGGHVVAQARGAALGHRQVERLAQVGGLVGVQAERPARADVDDPVHVVLAVEVGEVQRRVGHEPHQQVQDGARRVGERLVRGRGRGRRRLDRSGIHRDLIIGHPRPGLKSERPVPRMPAHAACDLPPARRRRTPRGRGPRRRDRGLRHRHGARPAGVRRPHPGRRRRPTRSTR